MTNRQNPLKRDLPAFRALLFDLDGTLVDSMWMWHKIDIEYLGRYQITVPDGLQRAIEGMSFTETAVYFKNRFSLPEDLETIKSSWNRMAEEKYRSEVPFKPGAEEFLKQMKERGIKMAVATSNSRELAEAAADSLHLYDYLDVIVTACEVKAGKPAPDVYQKAAKLLGIPCGACLVFEDLEAGIQAGHAAGMKVCAVEDAYSLSAAAVKKEMADYYITDYGDLL